MQLSEYVDHDATGLASLVNSGEVTALELAWLAREAHDEVNPQINAVVEFYDGKRVGTPTYQLTR
ncbi:hypothetical protein [Sinorhizobium meliloti]|uniref:hypothetical protein n=1 Tax=Rhizobium meliloti TaxID=382 RepID=UPI001F1C3989|nr:hypothetical protein [Sinorhizobium meliloti]